jgi:hypothetical protein
MVRHLVRKASTNGDWRKQAITLRTPVMTSPAGFDRKCDHWHVASLEPNSYSAPMRRHRRSESFLFGICVLAVLALVGCLPYRKGSFKGPATVTDSGFFSYYRYHFRFSPPLSLHGPGTQTYNFRGMPKDEMTVWFAVTPFRYTEYEKLRSLTTVLTVELHDDRGALICSGSGAMAESLRGVPGTDEHGKWKDDHWVLASGGGEAEFWRPGCTNVKFKRGRSYTLKVKVDQIDPRTPEISITPWIDGGGNELP